jgi:prepilin-type processing-associated H-X9-DG protein
MTERTSLRLSTVTTALALVAAAVTVLVAWLTGCMNHRYEPNFQSSSLNNVKMLTLAVIIYANDNDDHMPGWVHNPDGRFAHNVWDEQIWPKYKSNDVYRTWSGPGIRSYSDPKHTRVVNFGLNGLLIAAPRKAFDGRADLDYPPPAPRTMGDFPLPSETILFAELATAAPMRGRFGEEPNPVPFTFGDDNTDEGPDWRKAQPGWIDFSPREFVENTPAPGCYDPKRWSSINGIARSFYSGGGSYGYLDGHVKFLKISDTLGAREDVPEGRYWSPGNAYNQWNPQRPSRPGR